MKTVVHLCEGSVTSPEGFSAATLRAGIKESRTRDDLMLLVSDRVAAVAGTFTTNRVQAACVGLCKAHLKGRKARAVLVNAGNANACTGRQGERDCRAMAAAMAAELGVPVPQVFVCSTGTIGIKMPMGKVLPALPTLAKGLSAANGAAAANAILTTDTVPKQACATLKVDGKTVTVAGMTKGSGMIAPNMATMLAFLTTDAAVAPAALQRCLSAAVAETFNCVIVDGDQSTNDTLLALANGAAGNRPLSERHPAWPRFAAALTAVCRSLALQIARDGEGATKLVHVTVRGAAGAADARKAARAVAQSPLVKTAFFGCDPNWGRIIAAVGYSGARVETAKVDITFDGLAAVRKGQVAPAFQLKDLEAVFRRKEFGVEVDLHLGRGRHTVHTCDFSTDYVKINAEYMT
jgi:glutamate N-acetyltransferase/amino-acid N-acetyltransferase